MKLLEVEIHNVRGIVDQVLTVDGKNLVIWGPNGPRMSLALIETEMWEKIKHDLGINDIPSAAGRLRRGSEEFYSLVCESLQARQHTQKSWRILSERQRARGQYK